MGVAFSRQKKYISQKYATATIGSSKRQKKGKDHKHNIGKPVDFIHLTHAAGMDLTENHPLYPSMEKAQVSDISMACRNYANSYSFKLMQQQLGAHKNEYTLDEEWSPSHKNTGTYRAGSLKDRLDQTALFFDDLFTILHERNSSNKTYSYS